MKLARSRGRDIVGRRTRSIFGVGLALWLIQTLLLASGALLLMFCDAGWVDLFEQQRLVRNFMANPVEMILVEAFGVLCIVVGITGFQGKDDSFLDTAWGRYLPLFIGVCLILLFIRGLFRPWWLFQWR
jgi:hypothetical protein